MKNEDPVTPSESMHEYRTSGMNNTTAPELCSDSIKMYLAATELAVLGKKQLLF